MNDFAYDISHFDVAPLQAVLPAQRRVRAVPGAASKPAQPGVEAAQDALRRELMQSAPIHDALVQQYLQMSGGTFRSA